MKAIIEAVLVLCLTLMVSFTVLETGMFAQKSPAKVTQLTAACERKEANSCSCSELAGMYMRGTGGVTRDEKSAFVFLQRSCDAGSSDGCAALGALYLFGKGTAKTNGFGI